MMGLDGRSLIRQALRKDFMTFAYRCFLTVAPGQIYQHNWHVDAIGYRLMECLQGRCRRLVITLPPRGLKSLFTSVALPAFALGQDPTQRILCCSYAQELAAKHARDCRSVIESSWYREIFPKTRIDPRKNTVGEIETTAKGFRLATSVGGTLTGRGGRLIILDDPMKPADAYSEAKRELVRQWYETTLLSRLDNKAEDVIILVMQRLHLEDLAGHVLDHEGADWVLLNLPAMAETDEIVPLGGGRVHRRRIGEALHPNREPLQVLERIRTEMGSLAFAAQYQQSPLPLEDGLLKWRWFQPYRDPPQQQLNDQLVQSWDTASKADQAHDYSVCTTWLVRDRICFLLDVYRWRLEYPALKRAVIDLARQFQPTALLIEDKGSGQSLIQELRDEGPLRPIAIAPEADKVTRMSVQSAKIEAGHVRIPETAHWLGEFQKEMLTFPYGRFDDQIDSVSQALFWIFQRPVPLQIFL
jgi:predicted phage terminase large subunit-like protein